MIWRRRIGSRAVPDCAWLIYPFFAHGIIYRMYARRGWVPVDGKGESIWQPKERQEPRLVAALKGEAEA